MIKFFRKIREKLLNEGKVSSYLLYAGGEIVLVVIGILLALQINNWNERKRDEAKLKEYLTQIADNIKEDVKNAEEIFDSRESIKQANRRAYIDLLNEFYDVDLLIEAQKFWVERYLVFNKSGFNALINSEYMGMLNDSKAGDLLNEYYAMVEIIHNRELSYNNFIENLEIQFTTKASFPNYLALVNPNHNSITDDSLRLRLIQSQKKLIPYFHMNEFKAGVARTARTNNQHYKDLIKKGQEFIDEVNKFK